MQKEQNEDEDIVLCFMVTMHDGMTARVCF